MPVEHLSARRPPTECGQCAAAERPMGEVCGFDVDCEHVVAVQAPTAPPLPSGWEREDDWEDGRHRYGHTTRDRLQQVSVVWWPVFEHIRLGDQVVINGDLQATAPLDALLAYLRALTPEQVTAQPALAGETS